MKFEDVVTYLLAFMDINGHSAKFEATVPVYFNTFLEALTLPKSFYNIT